MSVWNQLSALFEENPAYVGFLGVLVGALLNIGAARGLHLDRVKREEVSVRRGLYGQYLATVEERRSLVAHRKVRSSALSLGPGMDILASFNPTPESLQRNAALADVDLQIQDATRRVKALRFEIYVARGRGDEELRRVIDPLASREDDDGYAAALVAFWAFCEWDLSSGFRKRRRLRKAFVRAHADSRSISSRKPEESASPGEERPLRDVDAGDEGASTAPGHSDSGRSE